MPTPEDTVIEPEAPYGQAKFAGEGYLGLWSRMHDLSTCSLRFGNVYGPRQDPLGEAGVIAIFCGKLEHGGQPTVFGDGSQTRDYVFVEDVVRACMLAGDSDVKGSYNVGRGQEVSVLDLVNALRGLGSELGMLNGGRTFEPEFAPARLGEVQRSALDPSRSAKELGFTADVELADGLRRTLQFVSQRTGCRLAAACAGLRLCAGFGFGACVAVAVSVAVALARERVQRLDLPGLVGAGFRAQPAPRVACAHPDQLLDELAVEEQVAEQLTVRRALAAEQAVEQREVDRSQPLPTAVAVLEHLASPAARSRRASRAR